MKPEVGKTYLVKHSSGFITARFVSERTLPAMFSKYYEHRSRTRYVFRNLKTGRDIVLKSTAKIRLEVPDGK